MQALLALLVAAAVVGTPLARASAQTPTDGQYEEIIKKGLVEFDLGHWSEAKAFFLRAHALSPNARTLRGLGLVSYELRRYVDAITYLKQALSSSELPLTQSMRDKALVLVAEAQSFITYEQVICEPKEASLRVDGAPPILDDAGQLMLDPGRHDIVAQATGYTTLTRSLDAAGGNAELRLKLEKSLQRRAADPRGAAPAPSTEPSFWSSRSTPQLIGLGLGAAGIAAAGAGATFSILALNDNSASKRGCSGDSCTDANSFRQRQRAASRADVATVSLIAAAALISAGAALYLATPVAEQKQSAWQVQPALGPHLAAVSLSGAF